MALFDVIKYEGDSKTLVYKHPNDEFNTKSQLIVQQSQEAIFYNRGAMADHFTIPGHYTLDTQNIPLLSKLINLPFGKESPFIATVYFIDKTERSNIKWGVPTIPFTDKEYGLPLALGFSGEYSYKISDAQLFVKKVLGTISQYDSDQATALLDKFVQREVTSFMTNYLIKNIIDLFTVETELVVFSDMLKAQLDIYFNDYGFELTRFVLVNINKHESAGDVYSENYKKWYAFKTQNIQISEIKMSEHILEEKHNAENRINILDTQNKIAAAKIEQMGKMELEAQKLSAEGQLLDYTNANKAKEALAATQLEIDIKTRQMQAEVGLADLDAAAKEKLAQADINIEAMRLAQIGKAEAEIMEAKGKAEAAVLAAKGLTGAQEMAYGVATAAANNTGAGNMVSNGIGLGMMGGVMQPTANLVGGIYGNLLNGITPSDANQKMTPDEINANAQTIDAIPYFGIGNTGLGFDEPVTETADFESDGVTMENTNIGFDSPISDDALFQVSDNIEPLVNQSNEKSQRLHRLKELKEYFDLGVITEDEYVTKKQEIINEI